MITITNTINITITIIIAIAIISISLRPNVHTYGHNQWEAGIRFYWKIWIGDLLSPRLDCLLLLRNQRLQLSTPWQWGIMRPCRSGHATDKIQTMISTNIMIRPPYAAHNLPHTKCHMPPAKYCLPNGTCLTSPGGWHLQLNKSLDWACRRVHGSI